LKNVLTNVPKNFNFFLNVTISPKPGNFENCTLKYFKKLKIFGNFADEFPKKPEKYQKNVLSSLSKNWKIKKKLKKLPKS